jgi:hypothetical protein
MMTSTCCLGGAVGNSRLTAFLTLLILMKLFMDAKKQPVIPHLIKEVPNFKAFVDG